MNILERKILTQDFLSRYMNKIPNWGPVGEATFRRTYSRRLPDNTKEEWWQTCERVIEGMFYFQRKHCLENSLPWSEAKAVKKAEDAYERLFTFKWTPPGRGLWMMGTEFIKERGGAALNNCGFISTEDFTGATFEWIMDALMLGIGVGFDTLGAGTKTITKPDLHRGDSPLEICHMYTIADDRESWAKSVSILIDSYLKPSSPKVLFDYSKIREAGSPINGFGGVSSGAAPLKELHESLRALYDSYDGKLIDEALIVDTENLIGRCVVSGNVRRSAALALGSNTEHFTSLKDPALYPNELKSHRWGSNNSIRAVVGMDYTAPVQKTLANGEPGYIWLDNAQHYGRMGDPWNTKDLRVKGFNPCVEQSLEHKELCTLVEVNPWLHDSYEDLKQTMSLAYLYAKTVTTLRTHWPQTNAVMLRNRRIGLGISGVQQAVVKFGYRTFMGWLNDAYDYVDRLDAEYSDWLCIPRSVKKTTIKPSGSVSLLPGSTPGMHWAISEYAIRRMVFDNKDPLLEQFKAAGYKTEPSHYYPNSTVVEFPWRSEYFDRSESEVSMWEQLEMAAQLQEIWSDNGVSVTIKYKPHEAQHIVAALQKYETRLKAVSFLAYDTTSYVQMPFEAISKEKYEELLASVTDVRFTGGLDAVGERFCDGDKCTF